MALDIPQQQAVDALKPLLGDITLTDDELWLTLVATNSQPNCAAAIVWTRKASASADLIDVKEGSSVRPLGSLHTNALKMAAYYTDLCGTDSTSPTGEARRSRTRAIERP